MSLKLLHIDTETTGIDPIKNGIIQIAGIIDIDGEIKEEFNFKCKPFPNDIVEDKALETNKITREQIETFEDPMNTYRNFISLLNKYVNRYQKNKGNEDKFYLVGQNIGFDNKFLEEWFKKCGDKYFYSYRHYGMIDLVTITTMMEVCGLYNGTNKQLETVAKEMGIEVASEDLHDALVDIKVTRDIFYKFSNIIKLKECSCIK